jgi:hypothetical protein
MRPSLEPTRSSVCDRGIGCPGNSCCARFCSICASSASATGLAAWAGVEIGVALATRLPLVVVRDGDSLRVGSALRGAVADDDAVGVNGRGEVGEAVGVAVGM